MPSLASRVRRMDMNGAVRYRKGLKLLRALHASKAEKSKIQNMSRFPLILYLLAFGAALPTAARAQSAPRADDARTCATQSGPAAIEGCTRAIASRRFAHRELALLHYRRAMLLWDANELDRAIADVTVAIHLNGDAIPTSADAFDLRISQRHAYALRGGMLADKRDYDHALADYDALIATDPRDAKSLMARAAILALQGACDRAVADYDAALAVDARSADGYLGRARSRGGLGALDPAIADYRAALAAGVPDAIRPQVIAELEKLGGTP
jgi:tetratricopeptide (TPR) repeat protein